MVKFSGGRCGNNVRLYNQAPYCSSVLLQQYLENLEKKMQTELAMWLCERAGVPTDRYLGLNDIEPFETLLGVCINVVSSRVGNKFVRVTEAEEKPRLYLYHVDTETEKHWHGIANIQGFFKVSYFCHTCFKPYNDKSKHTCTTWCEVCLHDHCLEADVQMGCRTCGRVCRSVACFERQKKNKESSRKRVNLLLANCFTNVKNVGSF